MKPLIQFVSNEGDQTWLLREDVPKNADVSTTPVSLPAIQGAGSFPPCLHGRAQEAVGMWQTAVAEVQKGQAQASAVSYGSGAQLCRNH